MKTYAILAIALLVLAAMPIVMATDVGAGIGVNIITERFEPKIWMCDNRAVVDDNTQNGENGLVLSERKHNYAFEGESIHWTVLVMDKNKIEEITDVVGTIGGSQGVGNDIEVECKEVSGPSRIPESCNARILEERLTEFQPSIMAYYDCEFTVETAESMHGEYYLTVEAISKDGSSIMDENEFWFLNPTIALAIDGDLTFEEVRPGTDAYSQTLKVGNDAEAGSGVILDMFISGSDFYDPSASGAACPNTNKLALTNFGYYVTNGAYVSKASMPGADDEGYVNIPYSTDISGAKRVMRWNDDIRGASPSSSVVDQDWTKGNALSPGSEMALTFKLSLPEPCVGDFSQGQIFFWGEAI